MKKVILICMLCCFCLSGCYVHFDLDITDFMDNETFMNGIVEKIITAINNEDVDSFYNLFSDNVQTDCVTLETDVEMLIQKFGDDIVTFKKIGGVNHEKRASYGKQSIIVRASYMVETESQTFYIALQYCKKDTFDRDNAGLHSLYMISAEDHQAPHVYWGGSQWLPGVVLE